MGWTKNAPTKPGFYYWQGGRLTGDQVAVVQVVAFRDARKPLEAEELCSVTGGVPYKNAPNRGPVENWGGRWAGPLPQPSEI